MCIRDRSHIFLFNRETGEPLFPIEEVPTPPSTLEGEFAWPTQPIPVKPPPFSRDRVTEKDLTSRTPEANAYVKKIWKKASEGEHFVPLTEDGTIVFPGLDGGGEWGGAAFEPSTGNLIVNASEMPWVLSLRKADAVAGKNIPKGKSIYNAFCLSCHGKDLQGGDMFGTVPSLKNLNERLDKQQITQILKNGKGTMPSFNFLPEDQKLSLIHI